MENKVPIPPVPPKVDLYKPLSFWSRLLLKLDRRIQMMETFYGYGEVSVKFEIRKGQVDRIVWTDIVSEKEDNKAPKSDTE